jgi:hypothetical protein
MPCAHAVLPFTIWLTLEERRALTRADWMPIARRRTLAAACSASITSRTARRCA